MLLYKGFPSNFCQVRFRLDRLENKGFITQSYLYNAYMSKKVDNCYLGKFWDSETKTFKTWSEICQKEYPETSPEETKNT